MDDPIVITGLGLTTCLGVGVESNWNALRESRPGLGPVTRFDIGDYPVRDGGEVPNASSGAAEADPNRSFEESHLLAVIREACRDAGLADGKPPPGEDSALSIGSSLAGSSTSEQFFAEYQARGAEEVDYGLLEGYYLEDHLESLATELEVTGPAVLVSNACAAGGSSIGQAARWLRSGTADFVVAAGFDPLSVFTFAGFGSLMALSRTKIRPFDAGREGMQLGDGFAALTMERLSGARAAGRSVVAVLSGYGESADAHHLTRPHPEGAGAALAMRRALAMADIEPSEIAYINCHGTATKPNDAAEAAALKAVFGESSGSVPISSSKPFFGHTLGGAGTVEAVVTILAMRHGILPANLNVEELDPAAEGLDVIRETRTVAEPVAHAMSNSFGFGGCNTSLVFSNAAILEGAEG